MNLVQAKLEYERELKKLEGMIGGPQHKFDAQATVVRQLADKLKAARDKHDANVAAARPVGDGSSFHGAMTMRDLPAPVFKDAGGNVVRSYRADEPIASAAKPPMDYGIGDIAKAAVTGNWKSLPASVQRAGSAGIGPAGGFLVPDELAGWVVDLARAQARVLQAGAVTIPMENGNLTIATVTSDPTPAWKEENAWFASDDPGYGALVLRARTLGVTVPISLELLTSAANINGLVTSQLTQRMALSLDTAALLGDGTQNSVKGIAASGVTAIAVGASLSSYGPFSQAIGKVLSANADEGRLSVLLNSDVSTAMDGLADTLGQPLRPPASYQRIRDRGAEYVANGIPTTGSPAATQAIVGDFSQVIFGFQANLVLEVSREGSYKTADGTVGNAFGQGQVVIRAYTMVDVAIQRPGFFCQVSDIRV